jgi:hypothetical protein
VVEHRVGARLEMIIPLSLGMPPCEIYGFCCYIRIKLIIYTQESVCARPAAYSIIEYLMQLPPAREKLALLSNSFLILGRADLAA